jgi:uncharacterized protein
VSPQPRTDKVSESVNVPFAEIPKTGSHYVISDDAWLRETGLLRIAPVVAELNLRGKGESRAEIEGFLRTAVRLTCDRCLVDYDFAVDAAFHLVLEVPDEADWKVKEIECTAADFDVVQLDEPIADLEDILRQQLYLSLPIKQVCLPNCKGLCPHCGADLNSNSCACLSEIKNSPFAALAALKKK